MWPDDVHRSVSAVTGRNDVHIVRYQKARVNGIQGT